MRRALHADGRFRVVRELIFCEARDEVGLSNSGVTDDHTFEHVLRPAHGKNSWAAQNSWTRNALQSVVQAHSAVADVAAATASAAVARALLMSASPLVSFPHTLSALLIARAAALATQALEPLPSWLVSNLFAL